MYSMKFWVNKSVFSHAKTGLAYIEAVNTSSEVVKATMQYSIPSKQ